MSQWSDTLIKSTQALIDALSYVSDFDVSTFVSSMFNSTESIHLPPDESANQAQMYLDVALELARVLSHYKPVAAVDDPRTWWTDDESFNSAKNLIKYLRTQITVLSDLQLTINSLQSDHYKFARKRMQLFKKLCEDAIDEIDHSIIDYNRFVAVSHPTYGLKRLLGEANEN